METSKKGQELTTKTIAIICATQKSTLVLFGILMSSLILQRLGFLSTPLSIVSFKALSKSNSSHHANEVVCGCVGDI